MLGKICVSLLFMYLAFGTSADDFSWQSGEMTCLRELGLNETAIGKINSQMITPEDDEDFNAFLFCFWRKLGIQNEKGNVDFDRLDETIFLQMLKDVDSYGEDLEDVARIFDEALTECRTKCAGGKTPGEKAAKVQNCVARAVLRQVGAM